LISYQQLHAVFHVLDAMLAVCREHQPAKKPGEVLVNDVLANIAGNIVHCKQRVLVAVHYITTEDVVILLVAHLRRPLLQVQPSGLEDHQVWAVNRLRDILAALHTHRKPQNETAVFAIAATAEA
jgi:hypothetical protein